jgi:hypothetical protein
MIIPMLEYQAQQFREAGMHHGRIEANGAMYAEIQRRLGELQEDGEGAGAYFSAQQPPGAAGRSGQQEQPGAEEKGEDSSESSEYSLSEQSAQGVDMYATYRPQNPLDDLYS